MVDAEDIRRAFGSSCDVENLIKSAGTDHNGTAILTPQHIFHSPFITT